MKQQKHIIILLGPQGSGKGTQGKKLAKKLNISYLEAGQLLRNEAKLDTERGIFFASIINNGGHLKDDDINDFMQDKLKQAYNSSHGYALDGYPRSKGQADVSDSVACPTHVILIDIPNKESIRRLSARRKCPKDGKIYNMITDPPKNGEVCDICGTKLTQRKDDTPEAIQKRLNWYYKDTQPLIDRYKKLGVLHKIDGMPNIEEVEKSIWKIFE